MNPAEEEIAFYYQIGQCLSQWAMVEGQLRKLVAATVSPIDQIAVGTAYLSIDNFRAKLKFADQIVRRQYRKTDHIERWSKLMERIGKSSTTRNHIAHYKAVPYPEGAAGRRYGLVAWIRDKKGRPRRAIAPSTALCLMDLAHARTDFHGLTTALANFREALAGRPEPFPKSEEQPARPKDARHLLGQMRAAFAPQ